MPNVDEYSPSGKSALCVHHSRLRQQYTYAYISLLFLFVFVSLFTFRAIIT